MIERDGSMIPIQEVAKGIFRIGPLDTKNTQTPWTSPFLVVGEQRAAVLEPGEKGQSPELLAGIKEIGVDLKSFAYIIASHIHLHHLAGVNLLLPKMPNAKVVVHQRAVPHLVEPTRLNESTLQVWGLDSGCPQLDPVAKNRIIGVTGGEVFDLGGRELEIIETTGHAPHHISIFDRLTKTLFSGDAMGAFHGKRLGERFRPDIVAPLFEVEKAIDSLRRLRALRPRAIMCFGYNGVTFSPSKTLKWAMDDIRAVERICREGMKQKRRGREIGRQVQEYYLKVGCITPEIASDVARTDTTGQEGMAGPIGMYRYLMRQDPSLEMPK